MDSGTVRSDQELFGDIANALVSLFVSHLRRLDREQADDGLGRYLLGDVCLHADVTLGDGAALIVSVIDYKGSRHRLFSIATDSAPATPIGH